MNADKITAPGLAQRKADGDTVEHKIVMVTAYDATFAALADEAGVDVLLVGDSMGMVVQGVDNTLPVTLDESVYHTRLVSRGASRALVVGDLPFGSYQVSPQQAVESSIRLVKEGGAAAVKLEGGVVMAETIEAISRVDIPVMAHIGLTPQSFHRMGGHRVQGRQPVTRPVGGIGSWPTPRRSRRPEPSAWCWRACRGRWRPRSPTTCPSRPSASVPARSATARSSCCTTCWASRPTCTSSPRPTPTCGPRSISALEEYAHDVRTGAFPDDAHSFH